MRYLVCYDMADDSRRQRLGELLLDYGSRVEESVFECMLDPSLARQMEDRIRRVVDTGADKVLIYGLCESCANRGISIGTVERPVEAEFYIL